MLKKYYVIHIISAISSIGIIYASNQQQIHSEKTSPTIAQKQINAPLAPHISPQELQALIVSYLPKETTILLAQTHKARCDMLGINFTSYPEVSNAHYSREQKRVNILYSCGKLVTGTITPTEFDSLHMQEFSQHKSRTKYSLLNQYNSGTHLAVLQKPAKLQEKSILTLTLQNGQYTETDNQIIVPDTPTTVSLSPDGKYLAMSTDNTVTLRTLCDSSTDRQVLSGECKQIHFSADGKYLIAADYRAPLFSMDFEINIYIFIINKDKLVLKSKIAGRTYHSNFITAISFIPDREHILCGFTDGSIYVWSLDGKTYVRHELGSETTDPSFINHSVNEINYSPDQRYVAIASHHKILLWRYAQGKYIPATPAVITCKEIVKSVHFIDSQHIGFCTQFGLYEIWQLPSALHDKN
jgi:WD40 repeat protein